MPTNRRSGFWAALAEETAGVGVAEEDEARREGPAEADEPEERKLDAMAKRGIDDVTGVLFHSARQRLVAS